MAIDYDDRHEQMDMTCDECGSNDLFDGSWQDCIADAKEGGWIIFKDGGEWMHFCSIDCRNDFEKKGE